MLSDYGKGVLTPRVTQQLIARAIAAEVPIIVDPKGGDYSAYRGASVVTPQSPRIGRGERYARDDLG